jgi:hypothetical protein
MIGGSLSWSGVSGNRPSQAPTFSRPNWRTIIPHSSCRSGGSAEYATRATALRFSGSTVSARRLLHRIRVASSGSSPQQRAERRLPIRSCCAAGPIRQCRTRLGSAPPADRQSEREVWRLASEIKLDYRIGPRFGLQPCHVGHKLRHGGLAGPRPCKKKQEHWVGRLSDELMMRANQDAVGVIPF